MKRPKLKNDRLGKITAMILAQLRAADELKQAAGKTDFRT